MKFVLILTIFGYESPDINYVVDSNMTGAACIESLEKHQVLLEQTIDFSAFALSCEIDNAEMD